MQTSDENKEKYYKLGDYKLIQYQILPTNITRTIRQTVRRITNEILGVKGLKGGKENVFKGHEQQHLIRQRCHGQKYKALHRELSLCNQEKQDT